MKNEHSNFVLSIIQKTKCSRKRTDEGGILIRYTRLRKFKKTSKKISIAAQIVAIWYISIFAISYLTTDTGAYFNDVEKVDGVISTAENFCEDKGSPYWRNYCKDNAGGGNGPEVGDVNTGEGTDPDNPGHNKDDCDDHTNAGCSKAKDKKNKKNIENNENIEVYNEEIDKDKQIEDTDGNINENNETIEVFTHEIEKEKQPEDTDGNNPEVDDMDEENTTELDEIKSEDAPLINSN